MSQLFASGGQSTGVSASASVLPMNTQDRFPLGWTGWISLQSRGLSRVSSDTTVRSTKSSALSLRYGPALTSIRDHRETAAWTTRLPVAWCHHLSRTWHPRPPGLRLSSVAAPSCPAGGTVFVPYTTSVASASECPSRPKCLTASSRLPIL